jgi:1-acyl-sn-glycerol-3-phosphate acyltransferase
MKEFNQKIKKSKSFFVIFGTIKFILRMVYKLLFRVQIFDMGKMPSKGKLILCCNHMSYADPVIIDSFFFKRQIFFMAKIEAFANSFASSFLTYCNSYPVKRKGFDRQAIRHSLDILENGEIVGIFPEGTRSTDGIIREGQRGIGLLAVMSGSDILPMAISGSNMIIQKPRKRLFFPKIRIICGDLIKTADIIKTYGEKQAAEVIVSKTMEKIKELYDKINK